MLELHLQNVRCFERLVVPLDAPVTVLIGENGAGKTTLVEALASLTWGEDEGLGEFPLRHNATTASIVLRESGTEIARWDAGSKPVRLPKERWLLAYGRYRRVWLPPVERNSRMDIALEGRSERYLRASIRDDLDGVLLGRRTRTLTQPDGHLFASLEDLLLYVDERKDAEPRMALTWARLQRCVRGLEQGLEGLERLPGDDRDRMVVLRRGVRLTLSELSDGFQSILVILLDVALRFSLIQPGQDERPIVLIDEVDLHLHPRWQRLVVGQLVAMFPEVRWVLTTHSGAVVQGAIDAGHAVWVLGITTGAGTVKRLDERAAADLEGAEIGSVLHDRRTFAVASRYSPEWEEREAEAAQLRAKIERDADTPADRKRLKQLLNQMTRRLTREDRRRGGDGVLADLAKAQEAMLGKLERRLAKEDP